MQQVTIGSKYQIVLPKEVRKKLKAIRPGNKVHVYPIDEETLEVKVSKQNWSDENYGALKKYWKGIDPIAEVEKMRDEWDK
ncbi:MAG: AbrB/MazE/SpoVT family DNA-binding domain-containing protein [Candidatus Levybacteria bacterium]|nr:AbrB/MazE/SpoVT family DNA-binding domain-containing protein [Candidatus Levybacteria bacterium]